jgi:eukaryotic-like serine/threonine-protein kinase
VPADVLQRKGYRLPTEAEWEYACRAGTLTSRYYGFSLELVGKHAWYRGNSRERAHPCALTIPNDLGLFDMLGNMIEWCQGRYELYEPASASHIIDAINMKEYIDVETNRLLRGGSFSFQPSYVRSAYRDRYAPSSRPASDGFRPSRTYD